MKSNTLYHSALSQLYAACVPEGILASTLSRDNYQRIWSRDGVMAGVYGLLVGDEKLTQHLKLTIQSLGKQQDPHGIIPSNIGLGQSAEVSYGSLAGRVDASCWWVIGASLLWLEGHFTAAEQPLVKQQLDRCLFLLECWEMNNGHLLYVPPGGNWADEYVVQGHTLYDNCLRLWGLRLVARLFKEEALWHKLALVESRVADTFSSGQTADRYHTAAFNRLEQKKLPYFFAAAGPMGYDGRWDMAGNAMALLLGLNSQTTDLCAFLTSLQSSTAKNLLPVFWPVIKPGDADWTGLEAHYAYRFKNKPYHFHNGGFWPIFSGWMALGLAMTGELAYARSLHATYHMLLQQTEPSALFTEYYDTKNGEPGGVAPLSYAATGYLLHQLALSPELSTLKHYWR